VEEKLQMLSERSEELRKNGGQDKTPKTWERTHKLFIEIKKVREEKKIVEKDILEQILTEIVLENKK
jgi:hypothetical protein